MTIHRTPILCLLACALSLPAADGYDEQAKALRGLVEQPTVSAEALPKFEALLAAAGNDDQRNEALTWLAVATGRAGQHEAAARRWADLAKHARDGKRPDRTNQVFNAEINRLRCLERMEPKGFRQMIDAAREILAWTGDPPWSAGQRLELADFALQGFQGVSDTKGAAAFLDEQIGLAAGQPLKSNLTLRLAQVHERANAADLALATLARVQDDGSATAQQRALAWMQRARLLDRQRKTAECLDATLKSLPFYQATVGGEPDWELMQHLHWASETALRGNQKEAAVRFSEQLKACAGKDQGWIDLAGLDQAAVLVQQGKLAEADALYVAIIAANGNRAGDALLARAKLQLHQIGDLKLGQQLFEQALMHERVASWQRFNEAFDEARRAGQAGERDRAEAIYTLILKIPTSSAEERAQRHSSALFELGGIFESRGNVAKAKQLYQQAMDTEGGDRSARVHARNAIESIRYFE